MIVVKWWTEKFNLKLEQNYLVQRMVKLNPSLAASNDTLSVNKELQEAMVRE